MIKRPLLKYKTRQKEKQRSVTAPADYSSSVKIGILFIENGIEKEKVIADLDDKLKSEGKETAVLGLSKNTKASTTTFPTFNSKGITVTGKYKSEELQKFAAESYDFLICFDPDGHYLMDYVLTGIRANCRIGLSQVHDTACHYEMMIKPADGKVSSKEILKYLKMIHSSEH